MARIALVSSSFLPRRGGVEEHVAKAALQLRELGYDVAIWTVDQGEETLATFEGIPVRSLQCPLPARSVRDVARFTRRFPGALASWWRAYRADRPDVLHVQCFGPNGVYATALANLTRTPLIYSHHGETFGDADGVFDQSALLRWSLSITLRTAARSASCSRFAARDLARFGADPDAVEIVYNGIDPSEPADGIVENLPDHYILGVGRLVAMKGFGNLIRAYSAVAPTDECQGVDLVIGGDGPDAFDMKRTARECGVQSQVHFTGALSRPQVGAAMAGSTLLAVPSTVEGFGITILEGWRAAVPVLATNRGGPPEFVTDGVNGLLVDPTDVGALAQQIHRLLADRQLRASLGAAGNDEIAKYSWHNVARQYQAMYTGVGVHP